MITVWVDELTPCLKDLETGLLIDTDVVHVKRRNILAGYNQHTGWYVNWQKLYDENEIYALTLAGTYDIQGLVALHDNPDPAIAATYVAWMVAAPRNQKDQGANRTRKYAGVGGHLFAVAGRFSREHGHSDGAIYGDAANRKLLDHYVKDLGAVYIGGTGNSQYRFMISGKEMDSIEEGYTYDVTEF